MSPLPTIECKPDGPYLVKNLGELKNSKGEVVDTKPVVALCRCGASANKPFCDGSHQKIGFSSARLNDGSKDRQKNYTGQAITVHDNRSICVHSEKCIKGLGSVFNVKNRPWINPDAATVAQIIEAVNRCPSGALTYTLADAAAEDAPPLASIRIAPNGPYVIRGQAELKDVALAQGAPADRYTLCRCGASKNKPFCDGAHHHSGFKDEKN